MPFAARVSDIQTCPLCDGAKPHVGGAVVDGCPAVRIGGLPAAVAGSTCLCLSPRTAKVAGGSGSVRIGGKPAARVGDPTDHGGSIKTGSANVRVG